MIKSFLTDAMGTWRTLSQGGNALSAFGAGDLGADTIEFGLPWRRSLLVGRPGLARRVLIEEAANYPKHPFVGCTLKSLVGGGVFVAEGAAWRWQRTATNQWLDRDTVRSSFDPMMAATTQLLGEFSADKQGDVDIGAAMTRVTANIIHRTVFGKSISPTSIQRLEERFPAFQKAAHRRFVQLLLGLPDPLFGINSMILAHHGSALREALRENTTSTPGTSCPLDFISMLKQQSPEQLNNEAILDDVMVMLLAGHETSAAALTWALALIAERPELQNAMRMEIREVGGFETMSPSRLGLLSLTRAAFRETLRLYPPIPFYPRLAESDGRLGVKSVKKGTTVLVSPWLSHRRSSAWRNAERFDPKRFLTGGDRVAIANAYMPFGLGPRSCPGAGFAMQEATLILAAVIEKYEIRRTDSVPLKTSARLTLRPARPVRLVLSPAR